MTQEERKLLLKDLCGRLPYGVILNCCNIVGEKLYTIDSNGLINNDYDLEEVKPYLFPMSSMTNKQKIIIRSLQDMGPSYYHLIIDHYNEWHLDYRNLIEKDLAIDATGKNFYKK